MTRKTIILGIVILTLLSCNDTGLQTDKGLISKTEYDVEDLYFDADTVIRKHDTLMIVNSKLDTTIIETGIITYLKYYYPVYGAPKELYTSLKIAIEHEANNDHEQAKKYYEQIITYYENQRPKDLEKFSDINGYLEYGINTAIIYSYSFERLGDLDKSIDVLIPYMANSETSGTKIHYRFIEQCIKKYGRDSVKREIEKSIETIHKTDEQAPEYDYWAVTIFGADLGLWDAYGEDSINKVEALSFLTSQDFYQLVK